MTIISELTINLMLFLAMIHRKLLSIEAMHVGNIGNGIKKDIGDVFHFNRRRIHHDLPYGMCMLVTSTLAKLKTITQVGFG
jgi:hypothetical protein